MPVAIATAAATTSTATTPPSTPAATAAGRTVLARARLINRQRAALEILFVKHGNRLVCVLLRAHLDKGKPARPAGGAVLHDVDCDDRACLREVVLQIIFGHGKGQIPDK